MKVNKHDCMNKMSRFLEDKRELKVILRLLMSFRMLENQVLINL